MWPAAGDTARKFTAAKAALPVFDLFVRAVHCNVLARLDVWLTIGARTAAGKILANVSLVTTFVTLGLETSVANKYLLPQGLFAVAPTSISDIARELFVTSFGNIVRGVGGVGLSQGLAYEVRESGSTCSNFR